VCFVALRSPSPRTPPHDIDVLVVGKVDRADLCEAAEAIQIAQATITAAQGLIDQAGLFYHPMCGRGSVSEELADQGVG